MRLVSRPGGPSKLRGGYRSLRLLGVVAAVACIVGAAGAQARPWAAAGAKDKPVLTMGMPYASLTFYPTTANLNVSGLTLAWEENLQVGDSLFHLNGDGTTSPELALSGHYVNTKAGLNKVFQYTLRPNLKFDDGTPLTATVAAAFQTWFYKQQLSYSALLGKNPTFTAKGNTVTVTLTQPTPNLPVIFSDAGDWWGTIASPACQDDPPPHVLWSNQSCGDGPYMLDLSQTVKGDHYTYVPNPNYWNKKAQYYSAVVDKNIPVPATMLSAIQAGQVDFGAIGADSTVVPAAKSAGLKVLSAPVGEYGIQYSYAGPDPNVKKLQFRQAISYAVDDKAIAQLIDGGTGLSQPNQGFPQLDIKLPASWTNHYPYNPAKAKALLAACCGGSATFHLVYINSRPIDTAITAAVTKYLGAIGITVVPVNYASGIGLKNSASLTQTTGNSTPVSVAAYFLSPNYVGVLSLPNGDLTGAYYKGLHSSNPVADWTKAWESEIAVDDHSEFASISEVWLFSNKVKFSGQVTSVRVGAVLPSEIKPG
jgi:peptide/nickel transport system substrate-binding protein